MRFIAITLTVVILTGCSAAPKMTYHERAVGFFTDEARLARMKYSLDLVRMEDTRRPHSFRPENPKEIIFEYDPDKLVGGLEHRMKNLLSHYIQFGERKSQVLLVEVELRDIKTVIRPGTFSTGRFGRYVFSIDADVIIRNADSTILVKKAFEIYAEKARKSPDGYNPSIKMDRLNMYNMFEKAMYELAIKIGNLAHRNT